MFRNAVAGDGMQSLWVSSDRFAVSAQCPLFPQSDQIDASRCVTQRAESGRIVRSAFTWKTDTGSSRTSALRRRRL
jgi:hypothetical protein